MQVEFGEVILEVGKMTPRKEKSQGTSVSGIPFWTYGVQACQDLLRNLKLSTQRPMRWELLSTDAHSTLIKGRFLGCRLHCFHGLWLVEVQNLPALMGLGESPWAEEKRDERSRCLRLEGASLPGPKLQVDAELPRGMAERHLSCWPGKESRSCYCSCCYNCFCHNF